MSDKHDNYAGSNLDKDTSQGGPCMTPADIEFEAWLTRASGRAKPGQRYQEEEYVHTDAPSGIDTPSGIKNWLPAKNKEYVNTGEPEVSDKLYQAAEAAAKLEAAQTKLEYKEMYCPRCKTVVYTPKYCWVCGYGPGADNYVEPICKRCQHSPRMFEETDNFCRACGISDPYKRSAK
jgi:RNase P subunit RPR2